MQCNITDTYSDTQEKSPTKILLTKNWSIEFLDGLCSIRFTVGIDGKTPLKSWLFTER